MAWLKKGGIYPKKELLVGELEGKITDIKQAIRYFEREEIGVKQKYGYKKI